MDHTARPCAVLTGLGRMVAEGLVTQHEANTFRIVGEGFRAGVPAPEDELLVVVQHGARGEMTYGAKAVDSHTGVLTVEVHGLVSVRQDRSSVRVEALVPLFITPIVDGRPAAEAAPTPGTAGIDAATPDTTTSQTPAAETSGPAGEADDSQAAGAADGAGEDRRAAEVAPLRVAATVVNISANGALVHCRHRFEIGDQFTMLFTATDHPVHLRAEVVRSEPAPAGRNYGCRFVGLSPRDSDVLHRYALHQQALQRRRATVQ